ncbi:MAG: Gfo/Idh/MocA family oxidoreductase [Agathobaculum sp.]|uniref:Gfo/Idh/MocA family protein n=1 Tax=Agathobaculum sp. TaxID=2048138 RepID=UPI002EA62EFC|nr:Gfo/Idh/MocA family oxidoreductase [Agathobaculum sp.]
MEKKTVRWGVLGCSGIGKSRTIPGLLACENAELYAIAGRNEEKLKVYAEPFAPKKLYTDYQALLDDENVDAVYLPLPNGIHMEWVKKAAAAGKHILCEKPMALTEEQVREMFAAAKKHGVLLEEAYAYRHAQLVQKVKEIVDSGAIGRIRYLESKHSTFDTNRSGIRYQKGNGGGAVYDVTCYNVSLASYLFGKDPEDMSVYCGFDKETGVDVSDAVMLRYEEGVTAMLYAGLDAYRRGCYSILGETGRIDVDHKFNSSGVCHIRVSTGARPQGAEYVDETTTEYTIWVDDNYKKEIELFSDAVLNGSALTVSEEESLRTARVCDAIRRAGGID